MPSGDFLVRLRERATTQRNVTIYVAILVAVPVAYAFHVTVGATEADFLLLVTLAVGVPTAYDEHWTSYDRTWTVVAWVLAACTVATIEFVALYLAGRDLLSLSTLVAGIVAFLVTFPGNVLLLAAWRRQGGDDG